MVQQTVEKPFGVLYGPHLVTMSVGYVIFSYAAVPGIVMDQFDIGFTEVGLLMSAAMGAFMIVQIIGGRLVDNRSTVLVLLFLALGHATIAVLLDLSRSYSVLIGGRIIWGFFGGLIITVGATQIARIHVGSTITRQHGFFGAMITFGAAMAFLITPQLVSLTGWFGIHAMGGLLAVPGIIALWLSRDYRVHQKLSRPEAAGEMPIPDGSVPIDDRNPPGNARPKTWTIIGHRVVLFGAIAYIALLGAYITLSTFITAYFDEIGIIGPLNAFALFVASLGRATGGIVVAKPGLNDARLIAIMCTIGAIGLTWLIVGSGWILILFPILILAAISIPFGAVFKISALATPRDATALAFVVGAGNLAALVLPALTGAIRDLTGSYAGAFLLMAVLNGIVVVSAVYIINTRS